MATTIVHARGSRARECKTDESVAAVVQRVNDAIKTDEKFVAIKTADGKSVGIVAKDVISIQES